MVPKRDRDCWYRTRVVNSLVGTVLSGLSALVVEDMTDQGEVIRLSARTRHEVVPGPKGGTPTARVHGFHERTVADLPVAGRRVVVSARVSAHGGVLSESGVI